MKYKIIILIMYLISCMSLSLYLSCMEFTNGHTTSNWSFLSTNNASNTFMEALINISLAVFSDITLLKNRNKLIISEKRWLRILNNYDSNVYLFSGRFANSNKYLIVLIFAFIQPKEEFRSSFRQVLSNATKREA